MANPFDATLKELIEKYPADWLGQLGLPVELPVRAVDTDLSTVSTQADKVFRVGQRRPWLLHLELQANRDPALAVRMLRYNVLLHERHQLPVQSVVVLLRKQADVRGLTGLVEYGPFPERGSLRFQFEVVRLWEQPVETLLAGGEGTLPLAPLGATEPDEIQDVVRQINARARGTQNGDLLQDAAYILMGLIYGPGEVARFWKGLRPMRESSTYQAILTEGRAEEARRLLLLLGESRFGKAPARVREALETIDSAERLEQLNLRLLRVNGWEELLAGG